jgi:5-methylcytosine-specific restriction endonuclease McrA
MATLSNLVSGDHDLFQIRRLWKREKQIKELEDRDNYIGCRICHTPDDLTIDHIIPKALRGQNIMSNKQVLCLFHNNLKGDLPPGKNGWWPDKLMEYFNTF